MNNIDINEEQFNLLFCKKIVKPNYTFYYDEELLDMYDHNYFEVDSLSNNLLDKIINVSKERNYKHIKIISNNKLNILNNEFEEEIILTLLKNDYSLFNIPKIIDVTYKQIKKDDIYSDLLNFEVTNYGETYGKDFTTRKMKRYLNKAKEDNGLNFFGVYIKNEIIASCYAFYFNNIVGIDGLFVKPNFRNKYVASNLIKEIASFYSSPVFLHASKDETAKEVYYKLEFINQSEIFNYLKILKD